jgi:acyl-coenzyme A thioesterase PaaI-like protein
MKKIINPFEKCKEYNNFASSAKNPKGLGLEFYVDGESVVSTWTPDGAYTSYKNILHGGIQSLLLDEIGCWVLFVFLETGGVTQSMRVNYLNPMYVTKGDIRLESNLVEYIEKDNIAKVHSRGYSSNGTLCCEAYIDYFVYPERLAKRFLQYPDSVSEFFETEK